MTCYTQRVQCRVSVLASAVHGVRGLGHGCMVSSAVHYIDLRGIPGSHRVRGRVRTI